MKYILSIAMVVALFPTSFVAASEPNYESLMAQVHVLQARLTDIQMSNMARVLGVSTSNLFQVTSNNQLIAQSYVPVTLKLATSWCADMVAVDSFKNTSIECTHEGSIIFKK
jgi:hypothetical protein